MFLLNSVTKIDLFVITIKGSNLQETRMLPQHQQDTREKQFFLNWGQFRLQWFIRFSEFTELNESSAPFRKNSNKLDGDNNSVERSAQIYQSGIFSWSEA